MLVAWMTVVAVAILQVLVSLTAISIMPLSRYQGFL